MASQVFIVTGASRGIGKAIVHASIGMNARVVAVARNQELLEQVKAVKNDAIEIVVGDVTDDRIAQEAVARALSKWGRLDAVIANASVLEPVATTAESRVEDWKHLYDVNFFSVVRLVQHAIVPLRESKGSVILVSSGAAVKSYRGWGAYGSSKAALNHFASTLGVEEPDITTLAIRPGVVATDMQGLVRSIGKDVMKQDYQKFHDLHQNDQLLPPEAPANAIAALCVDPPKSLSGGFFSWDDKALSAYVSHTS